MTDYASIRADSDAVESARSVKEDYDERWSDVFRFYAERRSEAGAAKKWTEEEICRLFEERLREEMVRR